MSDDIFQGKEQEVRVDLYFFKIEACSCFFSGKPEVLFLLKVPVLCQADAQGEAPGDNGILAVEVPKGELS